MLEPNYSLVIAEDNSYGNILKDTIIKLDEITTVDVIPFPITFRDTKLLQRADILTADLDLECFLDLREIIRLNITYFNIKLIATSQKCNDFSIKDLVYSGFKAFIPKADIKKRLPDTISKIMNNRFVFPNDLSL